LFDKSKPIDATPTEALAPPPKRVNFGHGETLRDIAASRDLSDEEIKLIKPALSRKHYKLVQFVEKYGVNWQWLLEGMGRIFEKDPIRLSSISTGAECAAVVATMPTADQQAIRTMVREIVQERDR
jgi:hypothetical protein